LANDDDIRRSAETMLRTHNGSAAAMCTEAAERWKRRGDQEAENLWLRILQAVRKLETEMPGR